MKKLSFCSFLALLLMALCTGCDDSSSTSTSAFFPLTATSAWVYDVSVDAQNIGRDSLFVNGETVINGNTYQNLKTKSTPNGFYTSILNNNSVRKEGDKLLITGTTGVAPNEFLPIDIDVTDFVLFKENSTNNAQLDAISGVVEQELQNLPLKIEYNLKSVFKESLATYTVPGRESYTNIKVIQLLLPVINSPITITILSPQDVIVSTQYYAEGIGMIYSKTDVNFQVNDFSQFNIDLPIPQQGSSTVEEFLD
jgi:hypothetical protein